MDSVVTTILILGAITFAGWAREGLLQKYAKLLSRTDHNISFPVLVTLTIERREIPWLRHTGVYDSIAIQRNPFALEFKLVNTTNPKSLDPFSFFVPLDQTALRSLSQVLLAEAERVDRNGNPFFK